MTGENKDEEIKLTPAEDSPWYKFMQQTIKLDEKYGDPKGWHWFCAFKDLSDADLVSIQKNFHKGHPFKSKTIRESFLMVELNDAVKWLKNALKKTDSFMTISDYVTEIDFSGIKFETFDFARFVFPIGVSFENTEFGSIARFSEAEFSGSANFNNTKFIEARFVNVNFSNYVTFNNVIFSSDVSFDYTTFSNEVYFVEAKFYIFATFSDTNFCQTVDFTNAIFSNGINFTNAKFSYAVFYNVKIKEQAYFTNAIFSKEVTFDGVEFAGLSFFAGAKFSAKTHFHNAKFLGYTTFEESTFEIHAPRFYGAEFNDEMFWTDIKLPKFEKTDDETEERYKKRIKDNENAYENLSTKLGNQKKYRDKHFFFRQEMNCQQKLAESPTSGFAFRIYGLLSGYGYNIGRAFWCWVGHMVLGVLVIAFISMCGGMRFHESLTCAIPVSVANANPYVFFGFESSSLKDCYTKLDEIASISFAAVKVIQTLFGIALLSLVIITLRTRFRLK